ncbi:MAG: putative nucleotidyltransferase substrate binding domain-containing protein, partial [Pseudomonadales bacterium]
AGSQARQEQLAHSDQDNAIIICDSMKPYDDAWFENLAHFVCDGLAACGYIYCPGNIMATNSQWRQPQRVWRRYFTDWVQRPTPQALLNSSVFFDLSTVYGDETLLQDIRCELLEMTKANTLLESHLSRNALQMRPPLGFFRDFVLVSQGEHKDSLDLKHSGIAPIVELARIYALALGIDAVNTVARLEAAAASSMLTRASADSLIDAFEFLCNLRLQHQSRQMAQGEAPNNFLLPKQISKLEREHLKDAFKVIKTLQDVRNKGL